MSERRKRSIVIGALCGVLLLMTVGYAAFSSILNIKGTTNISSNWDIKITNVTSKNIVGEASNAKDPEWTQLTATVEANLANPGDSIEYDIRIENQGTINAKLEKITLSDTKNTPIKFTTSGLTEGEALNAGSNAVLTLKIEYDKNVTGQPSETTAELKVTLDYVQADGSSITPSGPSASDTLLENVVTTGDGLYEDSTETGRYVYRGANPDNYITFNGETAGWRIISVESDGTLKIMKKASLDNKMIDVANSRTSTYCNRSNVGCNVWGSASTMLDASGNNVDTMKRQYNDTSTYALPTEEAQMTKYLNNDYYGILSEEAKGQIDNHLFNVGPLASVSGQTLETDVNQEKAYKWRGNIGLINPTDYVRASINTGCTNVYNGAQNPSACRTKNYLQLSETYWTISPYSGTYSRAVWRVVSTYLSNADAATNGSVHPTLFLKSDISLSGSGTETDPYTIN